MTHSIRGRSIRSRRGPRVVAAAAVLAALAGCSSTHVGESWQCPLAQGGSCTSVEDADPAVPARAGAATGRVAGTSVAGTSVLGEPLYRVKAEAESARPREAARAERPCDAACGPFTWLARLFGTDTDATGDESAAAKPAALPGAEAEAALPLQADTAPAPGDRAPGDPAPVETASTEPACDDRAADDLREPEYIGRIWIAPFVDGDGIYREGAYVRLVIAPARWRLP